MRRRLLSLTLAAAAAVLATAVGAETLQKIPYVVQPGAPQNAPDGAVRAACAKDFLAFCPSPLPGERVIDCIAGHLDQLQPACRAAIETSMLAGRSGQASRQWACVQDTKSFCTDVKPGDGRIIQCLADHLTQLQPDCQTTIQAAKARQRSL